MTAMGQDTNTLNPWALNDTEKQLTGQLWRSLENQLKIEKDN